MNPTRFMSGCVAGLLLALLATTAQAEETWPRMVPSADGVPISYEVHGTGEPALVFVHGWSCDGRYWRAQFPKFSDSHQVIVIDLAGHGHSGFGRQDYTMGAFAEDVRAVVDEVGAEQVILIGHSMGGPVSVATARRMPEQTIGIVGVDTFFHDTFLQMNQDERDAMLAPLRTDFAAGAAEFATAMFVDRTDPALRDWVVADMSSAPPEVAVSAMEEMLSDVVSGDALTHFQGLELPVVAINADLFPTDVEANRRHLATFDAIILDGTDHFLHMAEPERFNRALERVIADMVSAAEHTD